MLEQDIEAVREMVQRQEGCPDKDCHVCRANRERGEAAERVIALAQRADAQAAALAHPDQLTDEEYRALFSGKQAEGE